MKPMVATPPYLQFDRAALRLSPRDPSFVQDPYEAYAFMHANAPFVFWEELGLWCATGFDEVGRLLRDRRFGRERPGGYMARFAEPGSRPPLPAFDGLEANSMLELEPPAHTRLRALVNRAFVSRQVERLRPRIEALAHRLIDAFEADGQVDLLPAFAEPIPITIIAELLGVPVETAPRLLDWSHRMVAMYMPNPTADTAARADRAAAEFSDFLRGQVDRRRSSPGDDLLGVLIAAREDGQKLDDDELVASAILLLNAGHEATVHQTGNAVNAILAAGGDPRRFFTTPETTAATVEECLRFDAPLHMFTRYAYERVELAPGVSIEPGRQVGLLLGAANRDPSAFVDAHAFRPGRPDQKNVSFGAGIHFCIGAPLARLELQVALKVLFDRLPGLKLTEPPRYRDSWHFHGLERLAAEW